MGKYLPLTKWLLECSNDLVKLSFYELEDILGFKLPDSAQVHSRWWMNDVNHSQARGWLDAGYMTADSKEPIINQRVNFIKSSSLTQNKQNNKNSSMKSDKTGTKEAQERGIHPIIKEIQKDIMTIDRYVFVNTPFTIYEKDITSPFLQYDGHTVNDLLNKKHYASLRPEVEKRYPEFVNSRIQTFMRYLVHNKDNFYLKFLNKNGNDAFCRFGLTDPEVFQKRGLYLYEYDKNIVYIGRCRDSYYKRFNLNYGIIHPINCYKEGQSTNTYMNSLINRYGDKISIYLCPMTNTTEISAVEENLIKQLQPSWNRKK